MRASPSVSAALLPRWTVTSSSSLRVTKWAPRHVFQSLGSPEFVLVGLLHKFNFKKTQWGDHIHTRQPLSVTRNTIPRNQLAVSRRTAFMLPIGTRLRGMFILHNHGNPILAVGLHKGRILLQTVLAEKGICHCCKYDSKTGGNMV